MSTLIVQLPARDPAIASEEWHLPELPFALLDRQQKLLRTGRAALAMLPPAGATILMVAARDLVLLQLALPPVKGARLLQALPNTVEDLLIQDAQTCHLAVERAVSASGQQVVAAIDRNWFRFVIEAFRSAGHRHLKAVPVVRCLPPPEATPAGNAAIEPALAPPAAGSTLSASPLVAAILGAVMPTAPAAWEDAGALHGAPLQVELAIARGVLGEGMALRDTTVASTLAAFAGDTPVELYRLDEPAGGTTPASPAEPLAALATRALSFEQLARAALACDFDLCQFEFAAQPLRLSRATLRRWRVPVWLAAAIVLVAIIGSNLQWLILSHQYASLVDQQTELLLSSFPKTTVVLDPPLQMTHQLERLRSAAGDLAPDDFLALSNGLARSLAPIAPGAVSQLSYQQHSLQVTFGAGAKIDDNFTSRLRSNGLSGRQDGATWTIASHP